MYGAEGLNMRDKADFWGFFCFFFTKLSSLAFDFVSFAGCLHVVKSAVCLQCVSANTIFLCLIFGGNIYYSLEHRVSISQHQVS